MAQGQVYLKVRRFLEKVHRQKYHSDGHPASGKICSDPKLHWGTDIFNINYKSTGASVHEFDNKLQSSNVAENDQTRIYSVP